MGVTTDPNDPRLGHGVDTAPIPQHEVYLVLSDEERAKGWVRPYRDAYTHVGPAGPSAPLRDLTAEEHERYDRYGYIKFEEDPRDEDSGTYWTQARLDAVGKGCGTTTIMGRELSETYARDPFFYGATYCVGCQRHLAVAEFEWVGSTQRVGS